MSKNVSSNTVRPGVTLMLDFVQAADAKSSFGGFVQYMNRPEAFQYHRSYDGDTWNIRDWRELDPVYSGYMSYMRDDDKSDGLFTATQDKLSDQQVKEVENLFDKSQEQECPLYRGVISFDNDFLKEHGAMQGSSLDRGQLKEIARESISKLIEESHLDPTNVMWTGAIHTNTDNIHMHFSIIELNKVDRKYDMHPQRAIDEAKKVVANKLVGSEQTILRTKLLREELLPSVSLAAKKQPDILMNLLKELPDRASWEYNRQSFAPYRDLVDSAIKKLIQVDPELKKSFDEFNNMLDSYSQQLRRMYGDGDRRLWENTKEKRMKDFFSRAGNSLLKSLETPIETVMVETIEDIELSNRFNLDQMLAIRRAAELKLDYSSLTQVELQGDAPWHVLSLMEKGVNADEIKNILSVTQSPKSLEMISWVMESHKSYTPLLAEAWDDNQVFVIAVALRHDIDITSLNPEMTADEMSLKIQELSTVKDTTIVDDPNYIYKFIDPTEDVMEAIKKAVRESPTLAKSLADDLPEKQKWQYSATTFKDYRAVINNSIDYLIKHNGNVSKSIDEFKNRVPDFDMQKFYKAAGQHVINGVREKLIHDRLTADNKPKITQVYPASLTANTLPNPLNYKNSFLATPPPPIQVKEFEERSTVKQQNHIQTEKTINKVSEIKEPTKATSIREDYKKLKELSKSKPLGVAPEELKAYNHQVAKTKSEVMTKSLRAMRHFNKSYKAHIKQLQREYEEKQGLHQSAGMSM